ncbi:tRNA 2-selenouridine(34) synthase MnmH [Acidovorax sp. BL-A-41-H1]|uniref:tRNA 2-selenouridine(34) synthase MnmH n=1 Tax=Acidovorax sp. BL-A-41-H1 TaxID=3421102 RepID=UPI003F7B13EC
MAENLSDFRHIFLNDVPMMDVRAPVEFGQGAFPGVVNLPLMDDDERKKVGTCYKQQGQQAAIALGHSLVSGGIKRARIAAWAAFAQAHPQGVLYCFRGGLRSQISQQWLQAEAGIAYPRVIGGYKAMRSFLLETTQAAAQECDFVVLSGSTGTGKTEVIADLPHGIDLEGHANHRGSSFGQRTTAQPAQIDFENQLAIDFLKKRARGHARFVLEDEGKHVGSRAVPLELRLRLEQAPIVYLQDTFEARVERILRDYVVLQCADFAAMLGPEAGFEAYAARLLASLDKLARRLGGDLHQRLRAVMQAALVQQQQSDANVGLHLEWITELLRHYYDPMYAYQRQSRAERIVFEGERAAVMDYLRELGSGTAL